MKGAFGNEGALRFSIRIAREDFVIRLHVDQSDAFRTTARRRSSRRSDCAAASIRSTDPRVARTRMACPDWLRARRAPMGAWRAARLRRNCAERRRIHYAETRRHYPIPFNPSTRIVVHGLYRFTRNPMYIGFALWTLGLAILVDSAWMLLAVPIGLVLIDRFVITREERYLERKFGEEYLDYKRRVRRWI